MKKLFFIIIVIISSNLFAQKHFIGGHIGTNISSFRSETKNSIGSNLISFIGGLDYEFKFKSKMLLGASLLYDRKGFMILDSRIEHNNHFIKVDLKNKFSYLSLPIKVGYSLGNKFNINAYTGIIPSYLLSAKGEISSDADISDISESGSDDFSEYYKNFEISGLLEIGVAYFVNDGFGLYISAGYSYGLTDINKNDMFESYYNSRLRLSIGTKFDL